MNPNIKYIKSFPRRHFERNNNKPNEPNCHFFDRQNRNVYFISTRKVLIESYWTCITSFMNCNEKLLKRKLKWEADGCISKLWQGQYLWPRVRWLRRVYILKSPPKMILSPTQISHQHGDVTDITVTDYIYHEIQCWFNQKWYQHWCIHNLWTINSAQPTSKKGQV